MQNRSNHSARALPLFMIAGLVLIAGFLAVRITPTTSIMETGTYANSLFVAVHYVGYLSDSNERFAHQAAELKTRLGSAPYVRVGFAASLPIEFPAVDLNQTLTSEQMAASLSAIDRIVQ